MATYSGVSFSTVSVYTDSSFPGTLATIYTDAGMTLPALNPFPSHGNYTFYGAANLYVMQGDLSSLAAPPTVTFATLPTNASVGQRVVVSDSNTNTWGANITGSGGDLVLAWWNGTNWTVLGK